MTRTPVAAASRATDFPPGSRLPAVIQSLLYARRRAWWLRRLMNRHGDVFAIRVPPYADELVVVSKPEHVRKIFAATSTEVHGGEGNHLISGLLGSTSVMVADETDHARLRRLLMPAFNGAALRGYRAAIQEIAESELDAWAGHERGHVAGLERMNAFALETILQVVFGLTDPVRRSQITPLIERVVTIHPLVLAGLNWPRLHRFGPWASYQRIEAQINVLLDEEIAERRADPGVAERTDVLSRLLAVGTGDAATDVPLTDTEIRDQLITLLLAGHETTASALAWTLHELAAHPDIQDKTRRSVAGGDDKYVDAVFKEGLRLHTIIGGTYRRLTTDLQVGGWRLPAGIYVTTSSLLTHRDPENYDDPTIFRPERFLTGQVPAHAWYAFGGGVRRCLGAQFALLEAQCVLREVLSRYTLSLPAAASPERHHVRNITHVPAHGSQLVVTARRRTS
ncbi:cytochrome P450 [Nocardia sp. NPDC052278]|uniref:cytochrome P450 n=1 Tax=unclassified Nocardia TaxID=2637762 RepID=UPI00369184C6